MEGIGTTQPAVFVLSKILDIAEGTISGAISVSELTDLDSSFFIPRTSWFIVQFKSKSFFHLISSSVGTIFAYFHKSKNRN